jgi:hypothetical protein
MGADPATVRLFHCNSCETLLRRDRDVNRLKQRPANQSWDLPRPQIRKLAADVCYGEPVSLLSRVTTKMSPSLDRSIARAVIA